MRRRRKEEEEERRRRRRRRRRSDASTEIADARTFKCLERVGTTPRVGRREG